MAFTSSAATTQFLKFLIHDFPYCLKASSVRELSGMDEVQELPADNGNSFVGFIWSRGRQTPVYNLAGALGLLGKRINPEKGKVIVLECDPPKALWVERIAGMIETTADALYPLSQTIRGEGSKRFAGILRTDSEIIPCLENERLLSENPASSPSRRRDDSARVATSRVNRTQTAAIGMVSFASAAQTMSGFALWFGLSQSQTLEVCEPLPIVPIPGSPSYALGVVRWRNRPVSVIDLGRWLGFTATESQSPKRFVIARAAQRAEPLAFPAYDDVQLLVPPFRQYRVAAHEYALVERLRIRGWFECERKSVAIPDLDALFEPQADFART